MSPSSGVHSLVWDKPRGRLTPARLHASIAISMLLGVVVAYSLYVRSFPPGAPSINLSGLPASAAKVLTFMLPDIARIEILDGLRQECGSMGILVSLAVILTIHAPRPRQ